MHTGKKLASLFVIIFLGAVLMGCWSEKPASVDALAPEVAKPQPYTPVITIPRRPAIIQTAYTVSIGVNEIFGKLLVGPKGMTLYVFYGDQPGVSQCYDKCAEEWPPFLLEEGGTLAAGPGVTGELGIIDRADNSQQITYNGYPLYYWKGDLNPGEATGQGVDEEWFIVTPVRQNELPGNQ